MIYVGPTSLVTEDVITYTNRRGTSIGNLVDGRDYVVVNAGGQPRHARPRRVGEWIKLASSENSAIRAGYRLPVPRRQRHRPQARRRAGARHRTSASSTARTSTRRGHGHAELDRRRLQHLRARPGGRLPPGHGGDHGSRRRGDVLRRREHEPDEPPGQHALRRRPGDRARRDRERGARRRQDRSRRRPVRRHGLPLQGEARPGLELRHRPRRHRQARDRENGRRRAPASRTRSRT